MEMKDINTQVGNYLCQLNAGDTSLMWAAISIELEHYRYNSEIIVEGQWSKLTNHYVVQ